MNWMIDWLLLAFISQKEGSLIKVYYSVNGMLWWIKRWKSQTFKSKKRQKANQVLKRREENSLLSDHLLGYPIDSLLQQPGSENMENCAWDRIYRCLCKKGNCSLFFFLLIAYLLPLVFTYWQDISLLIKSCMGFLKANQIRTNVGLTGSQCVH